MSIEDRDYKFTDEQVRALGFSSYEELEKYYDLEYMNMDSRPFTKEECEGDLKAQGIDYRLDLPRRDRLKASIADRIGVIDEWDSTTWIPTPDEVASEREALYRVLEVYFNFAAKQGKIDNEIAMQQEQDKINNENSELSTPKIGGR